MKYGDREFLVYAHPDDADSMFSAELTGLTRPGLELRPLIDFEPDYGFVEPMLRQLHSRGAAIQGTEFDHSRKEAKAKVKAKRTSKRKRKRR